MGPTPSPRFKITAVFIEPSTALSLTDALSTLVPQSSGTGIKSVDSNLIMSFGLIL